LLTTNTSYGEDEEELEDECDSLAATLAVEQDLESDCSSELHQIKQQLLV
jgi:hypothetical protein